LELVLLAEGITVSLRSHFVLERVKNSHLCLGRHPNFSGNPPTGLNWLVHATQYGIRARGFEFESWRAR
jgi:hypothetical protein